MKYRILDADSFDSFSRCANATDADPHGTLGSYAIVDGRPLCYSCAAPLIYPPRPKVDYLSVADTARLVRAALRDAFPGVRFSVRSRSHGWSASIDVRVPAGGPAWSAVDAVVAPYRGGGFDGSIDLAYGIRAVLDADGNIVGHDTDGTHGSLGLYPAVHDPVPPGGRVVHFGADHIFVTSDPADAGRSGFGVYG